MADKKASSVAEAASASGLLTPEAAGTIDKAASWSNAILRVENVVSLLGVTAGLLAAGFFANIFTDGSSSADKFM